MLGKHDVKPPKYLYLYLWIKILLVFVIEGPA